MVETAEKTDTKEPVFTVKDTDITFTTSQGVLVLPLDLKVKTLRALKQLQDDADDLDAFFTLLDTLGDEEAKQVTDDLYVSELAGIIGTYFEQYAKHSGVSLGEA